MSLNLASIFCPDHPYSELIEETSAGDVICKACGRVVLDRPIDMTNEWRCFSTETNTTNPSRVGAPEDPLMGGRDLFTRIGPIRGEKRITGVYRQKFYESKIGEGHERLIRAFGDISEMCAKINAPEPIAYRAKE